MEDHKVNNQIKLLFGIRICLWVIALVATIYWIVLSFRIYGSGIYDVHEYASIFRPVFGKCLLISVASILVSFLLRKRSDGLKKNMDFNK